MISTTAYRDKKNLQQCSLILYLYIVQPSCLVRVILLLTTSWPCLTLWPRVIPGNLMFYKHIFLPDIFSCTWYSPRSSIHIPWIRHLQITATLTTLWPCLTLWPRMTLPGTWCFTNTYCFCFIALEVFVKRYSFFTFLSQYVDRLLLCSLCCTCRVKSSAATEKCKHAKFCIFINCYSDLKLFCTLILTLCMLCSASDFFENIINVISLLFCTYINYILYHVCRVKLKSSFILSLYTFHILSTLIVETVYR